MRNNENLNRVIEYSFTIVVSFMQTIYHCCNFINCFFDSDKFKVRCEMVILSWNYNIWMLSNNFFLEFFKFCIFDIFLQIIHVPIYKLKNHRKKTFMLLKCFSMWYQKYISTIALKWKIALLFLNATNIWTCIPELKLPHIKFNSNALLICDMDKMLDRKPANENSLLNS